MIIHLSTNVRNDRLQALLDRLDIDLNPGYFELYTAPMPDAGGAAITTQTKLGTLTLSKPAGTITGGELTLAAVADDTAADADGDIAWARFHDGGGGWVLDGDCGDLASTALIRFNTVTVRAGGVIQLLSGVLTEGGV